MTSPMFIWLCTLFITSIGQGEPAMMPVRRLLRSNLANSGWSSWAMNMVGTPYSAVQRSSAMACRVASGSKHRRIDHGRAVRQAAEIAHHHAEAVIERHGNAQPVVGRELEPAGDEVAVVQDVVMAERRALGMPGRARGELDVDGVVELQLGPDLGELLRVAAGVGDVVEVQHARRLSLPSRTMCLCGWARQDCRDAELRRCRSSRRQ